MRTLLVSFAVITLAVQGLCAPKAPQTVGGAYPYLCSGVLRDAALSDLPGGTIVSSEGIGLTQKDIDDGIARYAAYEQTQARQYPVYAAERLISERLIAEEARAWAKKNGKSPSDPSLVSSYLTAQAPKPAVTDAEIRSYFDEHAAMFGGSSFDQVKDSLRSFVTSEKAAEARSRFIASAGKRHKVLISSNWVKAQHAKWSANPVEKARASGKPSLVVFSVVGCCDKMHPVFESMRDAHGGEINAVFVNVREQSILSQLYGVNAIPVVLILDTTGKEVFRKTGFMAEESIIAQFKAKGITLKKSR